jgi:ABC-type nitrate/sulfonate/bicarbonate transport system substrate-binding protein
LHEVELPIGSVAAAVVSGRISAGALIDPELAEALSSGSVRILAYNYSAIAPLFMYAGWFCTTDYLTKNRPTVVAFARAMREAASFVNAHPTDTIPLLAKFTAEDPARIAKMHHSSYATTLDPALIQPVIDLCARYKNIPAAFDASAMIAKDLS